MEQESSTLRDRLLARLPQPENLAAYREEVASLLAKHDGKLRFNKWLARFLWIYVLAFGVLCFYRGEKWLVTPNGQKFEFAALVLFIVGVMQLLKFFVLSTRVEILREVKQVQLQLLELQASLRNISGQKL
ncbi:MAG: hypothetical protein ABSE99_13465 [Terracidiphilus sp.]|jgi:hypothetical protein